RLAPTPPNTPERDSPSSWGHQPNASKITSPYNGPAPPLVANLIKEKNAPFPLLPLKTTRKPPLASMPALETQLPNIRTTLLEQGSGALDEDDARTRAQGITDKSVDSVAAAQGELARRQYVCRPTPLTPSSLTDTPPHAS